MRETGKSIDLSVDTPPEDDPELAAAAAVAAGAATPHGSTTTTRVRGDVSLSCPAMSVVAVRSVSNRRRWAERSVEAMASGTFAIGEAGSRRLADRTRAAAAGLGSGHGQADSGQAPGPVRTADRRPGPSLQRRARQLNPGENCKEAGRRRFFRFASLALGVVVGSRVAPLAAHKVGRYFFNSHTPAARRRARRTRRPHTQLASSAASPAATLYPRTCVLRKQLPAPW